MPYSGPEPTPGNMTVLAEAIERLAKQIEEVEMKLENVARKLEETLNGT
ncbi:hypothetical protein LCGC14_2344770 [marine sediment metagenome]|uniref:Uncharacterized protein n=1 Tax=marine sediment metagenome TaxID=412755 RepID=A0A0F9CYE7_9ZZZZ